MKSLIIFTSFLMLWGNLFNTANAQEDKPKYKEYTYTSTQEELFIINFTDDIIEIKVPRGSGYSSTRVDKDRVDISRNSVVFNENVIFTDSSLIYDDQEFPFSKIYDTYISDEQDMVSIIFYARNNAQRKMYQIKRGNQISFSQKIIVDKDFFVKGLIFTVSGDVEVEGEVNRDIISLFGNIYLGPEAVARGDIVTLTGDIDVSRKASVYGEMFRGDKRKKFRRRLYRAEDEDIFTIALGYNRVDGFSLYGQVKYLDPDSVLPTFITRVGYAFASERWRYHFELEQPLCRKIPLTIGGAYYRKLASEDEWIIDNKENSIFAILAKEDYMDFYEAEGGRGYVRVKPVETIKFEGGYVYEETKWLASHQHLWAVFGGDKIFQRNFSTIPEPLRTEGIAQLDSTTNANLYASVTFETRDKDNPFERSSWLASGEIEWSHPDLNSDFDYRRYMLNVRRYQRLNRHAMLMLRGVYGGSDGIMPMYKYFFLGGLGTLHGYRHKEYPGVKFWLSNIEYRFNFPRVDVSFAIMYDVGQISMDGKLDDNEQIRHSLGLAVYFEDDLKLMLSQRLDDAQDKDPKFYVRLSHYF